MLHYMGKGISGGIRSIGGRDDLSGWQSILDAIYTNSFVLQSLWSKESKKKMVRSANRANRAKEGTQALEMAIGYFKIICMPHAKHFSVVQGSLNPIHT